MFIGPKVPTAYVAEVWQEAQSVPERYGMCDGASTASLGVKLLYQVSAVVPPWHSPQLLLMPVCSTEFAARPTKLVGALMWQVLQAVLAGFGMWFAGSIVLFQFAVGWQVTQLFGATIWPGVWATGRPCRPGLGAPMWNVGPASIEVLDAMVAPRGDVAWVMF